MHVHGLQNSHLRGMSLCNLWCSIMNLKPFGIRFYFWFYLEPLVAQKTKRLKTSKNLLLNRTVNAFQKLIYYDVHTTCTYEGRWIACMKQIQLHGYILQIRHITSVYGKVIQAIRVIDIHNKAFIMYIYDTRPFFILRIPVEGANIK